MNRQEWAQLAKVIAGERERMRAAWPTATTGTQVSRAPCQVARELIWAHRLAAVDDVARAISHALKSRSTRFDENRFLEMVGVGRS